jgi:hypothetical protein
MHLAVAIVLLLIHWLAFMLTPAGRSMVATAWTWLQGVFRKKSDSSRTWFSIRTNKFEIIYSSQEAVAPQELVAPSAPNPLKQFPPALGGECPTTPYVPANPEPLQPLVAPQITAPQFLDSNESQSRSTKSATPAKRRRPRRPRPQSSRRVGCRRRDYGSTSVRKRARDFLLARRRAALQAGFGSEENSNRSSAKRKID